jgi:site-specific recombinase XerD
MRIVNSTLRILFERFLQEKQYLDNIAPTTVRSYNLAFNWFEKCGGDGGDGGEFTQDAIDNFVVGLRKAGMSPGGCNVKIRSINSFLSWCYRKGHAPDLKIKTFRVKDVVPYQLNDAHIRALISYKPKDKYEKRLHALILTCIDTGCRIDELLTLKRTDVNLDTCLIRVLGKGNKERVIPFSIELRKVLYKLLQSHQFSMGTLTFCNRHGGKLNYHNMRRDLKELSGRLGIEVNFHDFRRYYITNAVKQGVNPLIVQRLVGHSSLSVTQRYIRLVTDDLSLAVSGTSALARYR